MNELPPSLSPKASNTYIDGKLKIGKAKRYTIEDTKANFSD
jgi:hypothetical protein